MKRVAGCLAVVLALGGAGSCLDSSGPVAGALTVSLATPNPGGDGAIVLTVTGPTALTSVSAEPGLRVFSDALSATSHFAVTGPLASGAILTIGVSDVRRASQYVATIQSVAANDYNLRPLSGYSLSVSK